MKYLCLLLLLWLAFTGHAPAARPVNDNFENATALTGLTPAGTARLQEATVQAGERTDWGNQTVWWKYRAPAAGRLTISTVNSDGFHIEMKVYLGTTLANIREIGTRGPAWFPVASLPVVPGVDYHIRIAAYDADPLDWGDLVRLGLSLDTDSDVSALEIPYAPTMANDLFAQRIQLTGSSVAAVGYNLTATNEAAASEPASTGSRSLWWTYRAPATGRLTISTEGTENIHNETMAISTSVYLGTTLPTLKLAATRAAGPGSFTIPVTAGTDYHIALGSASDDAGFLILALALDTTADVADLYIPARASVANDAFSQQVALAGPVVSAIGYSVGAGRQPLEPDTGERTLWWSWTCPTAGTARIDMSGSDPVMKRVTVWTGVSISALSPVATAEEVGGTVFSFPATAGATYRIAVADHHWEGPGSIVLTLAAPAGPPGENVPVTIGRAVQLRWFAVAGVKYRVQRSADLVSWSDVGETVTGDGTYRSYYRPADLPGEFYRVFTQP